MKIKVILGVILLVGVGIGSYVYKNRYSFFKYLPAIEEEQLKILTENFVMKMENLLAEELKRQAEIISIFILIKVENFTV